jgi:hypothetical protein
MTPTDATLRLCPPPPPAVIIDGARAASATRIRTHPENGSLGMDGHRSQAVFLGTALLLVTAAAAFVAGAFILFAAWVIWRDAGPADDLVGTVSMVLIAIFTLGLAGVAVVAAHDEWLGRSRGRLLGLVVAAVVLLGSISALVVGRLGDTEPLLWIACGLAIATAIPLLLPDEHRVPSA